MLIKIYMEVHDLLLASHKDQKRGRVTGYTDVVQGGGSHSHCDKKVAFAQGGPRWCERNRSAWRKDEPGGLD